MFGNIMGYIAALLVIVYASVCVGALFYAIVAGLGIEEEALLLLGLIVAYLSIYWFTKWIYCFIKWICSFFSFDDPGSKRHVQHVSARKPVERHLEFVSPRTWTSSSDTNVLGDSRSQGSKPVPAPVKDAPRPSNVTREQADFVLQETVEPVVTQIAPQPIRVTRDVIFKGHYLTISRVRPEVAAIANGGVK